MLGSLLAALRDERVVLAESSQLESLAATDTSGAGVGFRRAADGLLALESPVPGQGAEPTSGDRQGAIDLLRAHGEIVVIDCDPSSPAMRDAALSDADQLVLVVDADSAAAGAVTVPATEAPVTIVVNGQRRIAPQADLDRFQRRVSGASGLLALHRDRVMAAKLAKGGFSWVRSSPGGSWPRSARELAVLLSADWAAIA